MVNKVPLIGVQYLFSHQANVLNVAHLRATQDVGFMILHPQKGIYVGHNHLNKSSYMWVDTIPPERPIPVFASEYSFTILQGVTPLESGDVHQYQVACRYVGGVGTTTVLLAMDADRKNVLQKPVKFPDGTYYDYHIPPKKRSGFSRFIDATIPTLDIPFLSEKPPRV